MNGPLLLLAIAGGGALGAVLRYLISTSVNESTRGAFPWGTLTVNVIGSLAIGILWAWFERHAPSPAVRAFLITGLLGALTTFSSFSMETILTAQNQGAGAALANVLLNNLLCLGLAGGSFLALTAVLR